MRFENFAMTFPFNSKHIENGFYFHGNWKYLISSIIPSCITSPSQLNLGVRKFEKIHERMWLNIRLEICFLFLFTENVCRAFILQIVVRLILLLWQWNLSRFHIHKNAENGSLEITRERFCPFLYLTQQQSSASAHVREFMKCHKSPDTAGASIANFEHMSMVVTSNVVCSALSGETIKNTQKCRMLNNSFVTNSRFCLWHPILKQLNK